jgi:adenylosuccinate lyase
MEKVSFKEVLLSDKIISRKLSKKEIDEALDPRNYIGTAVEQVDLVIKKTAEERSARGLKE